MTTMQTPVPAAKRTRPGAQEARLTGKIEANEAGEAEVTFFPYKDGRPDAYALARVTVPTQGRAEFSYSDKVTGQEVTVPEKVAQDRWHTVKLAGNALKDARVAFDAGELKAGALLTFEGALDSYARGNGAKVIGVTAFTLRDATESDMAKQNDVHLSGEIVRSKFRENRGGENLNTVDFTVKTFGKNSQEIDVREFSVDARERSVTTLAVGEKVDLDGWVAIGKSYTPTLGRNAGTKVVPYYIATTPEQVENHRERALENQAERDKARVESLTAEIASAQQTYDGYSPQARAYVEDARSRGEGTDKMLEGAEAAGMPRADVALVDGTAQKIAELTAARTFLAATPEERAALHEAKPKDAPTQAKEQQAKEKWLLVNVEGRLAYTRESNVQDREYIGTPVLVNNVPHIAPGQSVDVLGTFDSSRQARDAYKEASEKVAQNTMGLSTSKFVHVATQERVDELVAQYNAKANTLDEQHAQARAESTPAEIEAVGKTLADSATDARKGELYGALAVAARSAQAFGNANGAVETKAVLDRLTEQAGVEHPALAGYANILASEYRRDGWNPDQLLAVTDATVALAMQEPPAQLSQEQRSAMIASIRENAVELSVAPKAVAALGDDALVNEYLTSGAGIMDRVALVEREAQEHGHNHEHPSYDHQQGADERAHEHEDESADLGLER